MLDYSNQRIKVLVAKALGWQSLSTISVQLVQAFITLFVATRVPPQEFALWGLAAIVYNAQNLLGGAGFGSAIVYYNTEGRLRDAVDSAFMATAILAILFGATIFALAFKISVFFDKGFRESDVTHMIQMMSLCFVFGTMAYLPQGLIEKTLKFQGKALSELGSAIGYLSLALILLYAGLGIWSLIVSRVFQGFCLLMMFWLVSPIRPRIRAKYYWDVIKELFRYGKFVTAAALVTFIVGNLDNIMVGKIVGASALGVYALAYTITNLVPTFLTLTIGKVFFPLYVLIQKERDKLYRTFGHAIHTISIFMLPTTVWLITSGPDYLIQIFGPKWNSASELVRILAFYGLARALGSAIVTFLSGIGRPDLNLWIDCLSLVIPAILIWPLLLFGLKGIAWSFTLGQIGAVIYGLFKVKDYLTFQSFQHIYAPLVASVIALVACIPTMTIIKGQTASMFQPLVFGMLYLASLLFFDSTFRSFVTSMARLYSPYNISLKR